MNKNEGITGGENLDKLENNKDEINKDEIMKVFQMCNAVREGHFILTSGLHSNRYMQCALVLQDPKVAAGLGKNLLQKVPVKDVDVVIGPALGGVTLAYEIARQLGALALFAEREQGVMTLRRGFEIKVGARVLVTEDVITTGGSVREVVDLVKGLGGDVVGAACLVDRSGGQVDLGVPLYSLMQIEVISYLPEDCPLCKEGIPLVKPGSRKKGLS